MNQLEALAEATVESTTGAATDVTALRERAAVRRRRRRTRFSVLTVILVLVVGLAGWRVLAADDRRPPTVGAKPSRPPATTPATSSTTAIPGVPAPSIPADQARVALDRLRAPIAVSAGKVWVANNTGIDVFDPTTLHRIATIPTDVPVVTVAANGNEVWLVTGDDDAGDRGSANPYTLLRVDGTNDRVAWKSVLPFTDHGHRSSWNLRLAAGPGRAWVTFGDSAMKVDAATGDVTPIPLPAFAGNIAADRDGLWLDAGLHIDGATDEITAIDGIPPGFMWSIAATDDAAWLVEATGETDGGAGLKLFRIDAATHAVTPFVVPGIAAVAGDGQIWVQIYSSARDDIDKPTELVGQVDPTTGKITRTLHVFLGDVPGSASNGYTYAPFAVASGQVWSAYSGLQRTSVASTPGTNATPIDLSTPLTTINSYYTALGDHDVDGARQAIALEYRADWTPSVNVKNADVTQLETLTRLHIKTPQPVAPPEWMATWPYSEWTGAWVTYHATYRANGVTHDGTQTHFVYLARAAGTTDWYIAKIGPVP